ncbi:hypothetical protein GQ53DRAFT_798555 [Thozetella sp. PMI_491]|nr:hypothetical protein GQ53DRAFT_798555 [Thozetella sp. PMI_491]
MASTRSFSAASLLSLACLAAAQTCKIQFDGRVPANFGAASFAANNKFFDSSNVLGTGLSFADVIELPAIGGSLFDAAGATVPLEVTISDKSIFNGQTGFRRAELLPASNNGKDASTQGVKTLHFSILADTQHPLNLTHEYQLAFLESADFSTNQLVLKTGTILGQNTPDPSLLQLFGNVNSNPPQVLFSTPFTPGVFNNFAVTMDFNKNTVQVFFSTANNALSQVTQALKNDLSGQGQFHFGVLKKGINGSGDITKNGEQEPGIAEGIIFGGIFEEDSADGCVSLTR